MKIFGYSLDTDNGCSAVLNINGSNPNFKIFDNNIRNVSKFIDEFEIVLNGFTQTLDSMSTLSTGNHHIPVKIWPKQLKSSVAIPICKKEIDWWLPITGQYHL